MKIKYGNITALAVRKTQ